MPYYKVYIPYLVIAIVHGRATLLPTAAKGFIPCSVEDILREIDAALERLGLSARAASIRAQGTPEMIRDMRRGHVPSVERLRSLCEVLDLEFFVGPRRVRRDERAGAPDVLLSTLERTAQDLARLTADAGGNPLPDDLWHELASRRAARRPVGRIETPGGETRVYDLTPPLEAMGTPVAWPPAGTIVRISAGGEFPQLPDLDLATCALVRIGDGVMAPTIPEGSTVVVDAERTKWRPRRIMAVRIADKVLVRRAALGNEGQRLMAGERPGESIAPLPDGAEVVGEVRLVGSWLSEFTPVGDEDEATPALAPSQDRDRPAD